MTSQTSTTTRQTPTRTAATLLMVGFLAACTATPPIEEPSCEESCTSDDPCQLAACDEVGGCVLTAAVDGVDSCSDGDSCTTKDTCTGGKCIGTALDCDDGNTCTADSCAAGQGCQHAWTGAQCDDGDPCTTGDSCKGSACKASTPTHCDDDNPCTTDSCAADSGCKHAANNADCDDGDPCTTGDSCAANACQAGAPNLCDDGSACTEDACIAGEGCEHQAVSGACDDDDACTLDDSCDGGECVGVEASCDDDNPCTTETCDAKGGCLYDANKAACDDGDACTSSDGCAMGACKGIALECADGNPCTSKACDPATGCTFGPATGACDDGNACTHNDSCTGGACAGVTPASCDDGNACTQDLCAADSGCTHKVANLTCDDGDSCTQGDACKAGSCVAGPATGCDTCGNGKLELAGADELPSCANSKAASLIATGEALAKWLTKPTTPILITGQFHFKGGSLSVATDCKVTLAKQARLMGLSHLLIEAADLAIEGRIDAKTAVTLRAANSFELANSARIDAPMAKVSVEAKSASVNGRVAFGKRLCVEAGSLNVNTSKAPVAAPLNGKGDLVLRSIGGLNLATNALIAGKFQARASGALNFASGAEVDGATDALVDGATVAMHGCLKAKGKVEVKAMGSLQFGNAARILHSKSTTLSSKGAASVDGRILDATAISVDVTGALDIGPSASLMSSGAVTIACGANAALHGTLKNKGKTRVMAKSVTSSKTAAIAGASEVELLVGGDKMSIWAGQLQSVGDVFFKGAKLRVAGTGAVVSNSKVTMVALDSLQLNGAVTNNGDVFMSAKTFSVGNKASLSGNDSCVISGEPVAGSAPLSGCVQAM